MNLSKGFDCVRHVLLLGNFAAYGLNENSFLCYFFTS